MKRESLTSPRRNRALTSHHNFRLNTSRWIRRWKKWSLISAQNFERVHFTIFLFPTQDFYGPGFLASIWPKLSNLSTVFLNWKFLVLREWQRKVSNIQKCLFTFCIIKIRSHYTCWFLINNLLNHFIKTVETWILEWNFYIF